MAKGPHSIVLIDYGQIEHRVFAMASEDKASIKLLWNRDDVHGRYANKIAIAYPPRVGGKEFLKNTTAMKGMRTDTKNQFTFPLYFGATLESVAGYLNVPADKMEHIYKEFLKEFAGIFEWQKGLKQFYDAHGYVENLFGRRRYGPLSFNQVLNTPIQGTAAELVLDAMNRLARMAIDKEDWYFYPRVQVHDELQFILPNHALDYYVKRILKVMLDMPFDFVNVPITCELSLGPNLLDMKEIVVASSDGRWDWHDKKPEDRKLIKNLFPKLYHTMKEAA